MNGIAIFVLILFVLCFLVLECLKPTKCPKCGSRNLLIHYNDLNGALFECLDCGLKFNDF